MANAVTTKDDGFDLPDRGYVHELGEGSSSRDEPSGRDTRGEDRSHP